MDIAYINKPHYDDVGYDSWIVNEEHRVFGVFDGMGVSDGARAASMMLSNKFGQVASTGLNAKALGEVINSVSRTLSNMFPNDGSTATVVRINSEGQLYYASIGDSRLYVMRKGRIKQVTSDEGLGNMLTNYVGAYSHGVCQIGEINSDDWDAFMLCTDGITGDWQPQFIYDDEIERLFTDRLTSKEICRDLVSISKKDDDKTVIVVNKYKGENQ